MYPAPEIYSISGQSAGSALSSVRASVVKDECKLSGTFSQPRKSATLLVRGLENRLADCTKVAAKQYIIFELSCKQQLAQGGRLR